MTNCFCLFQEGDDKLFLLKLLQQAGGSGGVSGNMNTALGGPLTKYADSDDLLGHPHTQGRWLNTNAKIVLASL